MDDEPPVLESVGDMIESLGFAVMRASDGRSAVRLYETSKADIDLVILDMVMPEMDGLALYQSLRAMDPEVKVVFISGYGPGMSFPQPSQGSRAMLTKPFTRDELAEAIDKALVAYDAALCNHHAAIE